MESVLHGYCGLYCGACGIFLATEKGEDALAALAATMEMSPDDVRCHGCKSEQVAIFCRECAMKRSAQQKGYEFCYECSEMPCKDLTGFIHDTRYPYHLGVPKNLEAIRQQGLVAWLEAQDRRWRCPSCGAKFSWWDEVCRNCGQPVANYKADL